MPEGTLQYRTDRAIPNQAILRLYRRLDWSAADKPDQLCAGLKNSDSLVTAWSNDRLIGLANAISDGHLVVYYPHVLVDPEFQNQGIGTHMVQLLRERYRHFHQHSVLADKRAIRFYDRNGFRESPCQAMWIYDGADHD